MSVATVTGVKIKSSVPLPKWTRALKTLLLQLSQKKPVVMGVQKEADEDPARTTRERLSPISSSEISS